ncbi:glycosyltransferase family 4 protein [Siphonobacter sp. SORGH_AS_1065]|uniref:glycosyltransferase family 4 protein n=1 Tax=Siphonobacter sp. SORGH_AS_1065 TaxID=3041795 RepID=UPI0027825141|nr:glycosyltransferase family 4 protein [Siphonobacter sp. SORGH_AS_1065]MDQ1088729.1 glycosyltransferase involved in cell wall biosynthesis [Siphonobacter sp. SORGH_AS_1065]
MKKILFISHDANRAGAQILLLRFLKQLKNVPEYQFKILLRHGGSLLRDFEKVAPVYHWYHRELGNRQKVARLLNRKTFQEQILKEIKNERYDLIVSNTITNGELLHQLRPMVKCSMVTYAHEMPMGIAMYTDPSSFNQTLRYTDAYWACSEAQRLIYIERFGIDPAKISVLPSLLPDGAWQLKPSEEAVSQIRKLLELPEGALVVGAVGTFDWRKGIDIFVQLARQSEPETHFVWVGGHEHQVEYHMITEDIRRLGLSDRVHLIPHSDRPFDFISAFDVFVLTSREEPYPLVVLEAALLARPIVCFAQSGGAPDFVEQDAGFVANYLDSSAMSHYISQLLQNPELRQKMGHTAREKVFARHQDERAMQAFLELIEKSCS